MDQFPVDRRSVIFADSADWDACDYSSTLQRRRVIDKWGNSRLYIEDRDGVYSKKYEEGEEVAFIDG